MTLELHRSMVPVPKEMTRTRVPLTTCNSNILVDRAVMRCPWWHRNGLPALTGHPKEGAPGWMMCGVTQAIQDGILPGNQNADNIGPELQEFEFLVYPSNSIQTDGIKAGLLMSFGSGQVGGQVLVAHPDYLLAAIEPAEYDSYKPKRYVCERASCRKFNDFLTKRSLVVLKESPPYPPELEPHVLLNPLARASKDSTEMITAVRHSDVFLKRNFTEQELAYCCQSPDFMASLAGGWAAKEAVFKALKTPSQGAGAAMKEIELLSGPSGPSVLLTGHASKIALEKSISKFELSISHSDEVAMAFVVACR
ncbi:hypothetical protein PCANC_18584 [Puccinia coronata f. sp. avenae]|uniref:4'-phosphopantetheinyl transferase domain-containing protein n=1 Tax=Puccinia coronata f. sp. avenae TaxID=200324 RepID=A0A2N5TMH9_9BASI|nr:hypothetical protein PCANC_18584 [Puccinia coronata f. sp. avenae]